MTNINGGRGGDRRQAAANAPAAAGGDRRQTTARATASI